MSRAIDAIWETEFVTGLVFGAGALVLAWGSGLVRRRRTRVGGVLLALAALLALQVAGSVPPGMWWGLGSLAVAGLAVQTWPALSPFGAAIAIPGAWLVGMEAALPGDRWVRWFVVIVIVIASPLVSRFAAHPVTGTWAPMMFAVFSIGIFLSVPDTEEALVLLGVSLPMVALSLPGSPSRFGAGGAYASVGVALWVIASGGVGRPAAIIGATACLGLLLADPVARLISPGRGSLLDRLPAGWGGLAVAAFVQLVLVVAVARTAGLAETVTTASLVAAVFLVLEVAVLVVGGRRPRGSETTRSAQASKL